MSTRRQDLLDYAFDNQINVKVAQMGDLGKSGIHLLNPSLDDLERAIEQAIRDNYPSIYIHSFCVA